MARDLYGDMLSRALQRQAPSGHFPAYITPFEAGLLRSRGGGVPPGGGQYMAGGIPAFMEPDDAGGGTGAPGDPGVDGGGPADADIGQAEAEAAEAAANAAAVAAVGFGGNLGGQTTSQSESQSDADIGTPSPAEGLLDIDIAISEDVLGQIAANAQEAKGKGQTSQNISMQNTQALLNAVNYGLISNAQAVSMAANDISQGGLGSMSPGGFAATPGNTQVAPTMEQIAQINLQNPETLDYAINVPNPQMGTVAFQNAITSSQAAADVGMTNVGMDIGLGLMSMAPGPIGLIGTGLSMATGRGLSNLMAPVLSSIPGASVVSGATSAVTDALSDLTSPVTNAVSQGVNALGEVLGQGASNGTQAVDDALSSALGGLPGADQESDPTGFGSQEDVGGAPVIPVPPVAADPVVSEEVVFSPTVPIQTSADIDERTRQRLLANVVSGLERTGRPTQNVTAFGPLFA